MPTCLPTYLTTSTYLPTIGHVGEHEDAGGGPRELLDLKW